jgi:peroxiredoxin Q/BCP
MIRWTLIIFAVAAIAALLVWRSAIQATVALPKIGDVIPPFMLPDQTGKMRSSENFRGNWLVLYFYPRDDTPGCTKEACMFRDDWQKLTALGAEVVGISVDDTPSHAAFAKKYHLPFPLLSDESGQVALRYGSLSDFGLFKIARRNTFLVDPRGTLVRIYLGASVSRNSQQVIEDLKKLAIP